jgi:hypothetical protein
MCDTILLYQRSKGLVIEMATSIIDYCPWSPKPSKDVILQKLHHNFMIISFGGDNLDPFGHIIHSHKIYK